jgi:small subunit ribosomal protein S8
MSINDPIADLFTRIRNALAVRHKDLEAPYSVMSKNILAILKEEGFINSFTVVNKKENSPIKSILVQLKYDEAKRPMIDQIKRVSKPGKRHYVQKSQIPKVQNGFGISILSTPKGVLSGREARLANVGGELLGLVY